MNKTKFLIIDGNSIASRAAFAKQGMSTSAGRETGGTYLFFVMLNTILNKMKPTHAIVTWDVSRDTFRKKLDANYKATRESRSENLYMQYEDIKKILDAIGIKYLGMYGYEADDLLGTFSKISKADENIILSGDKDSFQLVDSKTKVYFPKMGVTDLQIVDEEYVQNKYSVNVQQYIDLKALMGDSGDNVEGILGCGEKKAAKLLNDYGTLANILAHEHEIKGKLGENLRAWAPKANVVKELVTIVRDVPVPFTFDDCLIQGVHWESARPIFEELEFASFITKLDGGKLYNG